MAPVETPDGRHARREAGLDGGGKCGLGWTDSAGHAVNKGASEVAGLTPNEKALSCQVLVVGGGLAATMAAITAAEDGADVLMVVKGEVGASGSSARSGGIIAASLCRPAIDASAARDDIAAHIDDTLRVGCGLCSDGHVHALAEDAPVGIRELERLGVSFSKTGDGQPHLLKLPGNTRPRGCSVIGGGPALMDILRRRLEELPVRLVENTAVTGLSTQDGCVVGARAQSLSSDSSWTIRSGATVLATGGAPGLFATVSGDDRNAGDGLVLGYEAGAELANLEFVEFTLVYKIRRRVLAIAGLAPFLGRGCTLVNRRGERFMEQYYTPDVLERAGRPEMLRAVLQEIEKGHSPICIECSALSQSVWEEFERSQGQSILRKIRDAGADYLNEPIEVVPAQHSLLAGLVTDTDARTCVPGLWAAGECATGVHGAARLSGNGLSACLVFGRRAGRNAAFFALDRAKTISTPSEFVDGSCDDEPTQWNPERLSSLREEIRALAEDALGVLRDPTRLRAAKARFYEIRTSVADSTLPRHSLAVLEVVHLAMLGELMVEAALQRKESRGLHFRTDAASTNETWRKWLVVRKRSGNGMPIWSYNTQLSPVEGWNRGPRTEQSSTSLL